MARLRDMPTICRTIGPIEFGRRVWQEVLDDHVFTWASARAYSWLFALFPFLLFLLTLLPYLPDGTKEKVKEMVYAAAPGRESADTVWENVDANVGNLLYKKEGKTVPRFISLALALWAASGGMAMTMAAMDRCYDVDKGRPFYTHRPLAVGLTVSVAGLMVLVLAMLPAGTIVRKWLETEYLTQRHPALILFDIVRWSLAVFFMVSVVALVYYKGPSVKHRFLWLTPGGLFTVIVWAGLAFGFRYYVNNYSSYSKTYGTVGGVVVLLLFFYIDALVLLIGAEINSEIDFEVLGIRRGARDFRKAEAIADVQAADPPDPEPPTTTVLADPDASSPLDDADPSTPPHPTAAD